MTQPDVIQAQQQGDGTGQDTSATSITTAANDASTANYDVTGDAQGAGSASYVMAGSDSVDPSGIVTS
jgi:hypothetical protein